ncbi:dedicator of cytokinesis protein 1-like isoform X2 [Dysidea avara]|uniref:dedicator of cytokinesis protein 1-like isoform X2 n=1 Tax=Dysidea avara TaxID=196820 RepID=UPI00332EFC37
MTWQPTVNAKLGVVVHTYDGPKSYPFVSLNFGDTVQILEECGGWYRGYPLKRKNKTGIFPASHVHLKECTVTNPGPSEKVVPKEDPIIKEMTDVLRMWGEIWKKVYVEGSIQQYQDLTKLMRDILDWRRQILSQTLPRDELKELKLRVANKIDFGNKLMGLDVIPRDEATGEVLDPRSTSVIHLYRVIRKQSSLGIVESSGTINTTRTSTIFSSFKEPTQFHLFMKLEALVLAVRQETELLFSIYDAKKGEVVSEKYIVALQQMGLPKENEKINQTFVTFTDFDNQDLHNKELYLFCEVIRISSYFEGKKVATPVRIPLGIAVHPIHEHLSGKFNEVEEKQVQMEIVLSTAYNCSDYAKLPEYAVQGLKSNYTVADKGTGVFVALRMLYGSLNKVKEENPLLFKKFTCVCRKMKFPEVIRPGDKRHDIYLQLVGGYFYKGTKKSDKNVEITFNIVDAEGKPIPDCISAGEGEGRCSSYKSLVFYHTATCQFNEYIKISIPKEMMPHAHANFVFAHHSAGKARRDQFGCAHLRLMNEDHTAINDGSHDMVLYNYKELGSNMKYLQLPCEMGEKGEPELDQHLRNFRDNFSIKTTVCSTQLTQDVNLLKLLHWKENKRNLLDILSRVKDINGDEITKFLQDTFDALFAILESREADDFGHVVFEVLSYSIALLSERKYTHFRAVLDTYSSDMFKAATVHDKLMDKLRYVFQQVMVTDGTRQLADASIGKTFRAAEYLIKFIIQSRLLYDRAMRGKNKAAFLNKLKGVITTFCDMIKHECPEGELVAPKYQAMGLQFFHSTFPDFLSVMNKKSFSEILADFLMNMRETKLRGYKSAFMLSVVNNELFKDKESRVILLPAIVKQLSHLFFMQDDMANQILGDILLQLHAEEKTSVQQEVQMLLDTMMGLLFNVFIEIEEKHDWEAFVGRPSIAMVQTGVCILGMMQLVDETHYAKLKQTFQLARQLEEFVLNILYISQVLADHNMYPPDWGIFLLVQSQVILRLCEHMSQILTQDFLDAEQGVTFSYAGWKMFFELCVSFCVQPCLQLEIVGKSSPHRKAKIIDNYGDMRITMNTLMLVKWKILSHVHSQFVPDIVGPFLKVSLITEPVIKRSTLLVFFDLMVSQLQTRGNLLTLETEMIDKLDTLISEGMGDSSYRQMFYRILTERCRTHPDVSQQGGQVFIDSLTELLGRLLDYRSVEEGAEHKTLRMFVMFNLLNFYKEVGREEMYIRYIYKLADLHKEQNSYVEAAYTLLLHAELLQWTSEEMKKEGPYRKQTSAERKEALYNDIIDYFSRGKLWECGIEQCKDLCKQHETVTYDYVRLAEIHHTISRYYGFILNELRADPEYFRVGFYGGFPPFLKNKVFIFRGLEYEKLSDFNERLSEMFPHAKLMKSLTPPGIDILESQDQFIQSCSVEPVSEQYEKFEGKTVNEQISHFYRTNYVKQFVLKRPFFKGKKDKENEFKTLYVERTVFTTAYPFPGKLRWFEVVKTEVTELNPVENAIDTVYDNLHTLQRIVKRVMSDRSQSTNQLTMKLNGTLDAAVNGGLRLYEVFFTDDYQQQYPEHASKTKQLRKAMQELCKMLGEALDLHKSVCPETMRPMHERMERELYAEFSQKYGAPTAAANLSVSEEPAFRRRSATRSRPISTLSTIPLGSRPDSLCSVRPPSTSDPISVSRSPNPITPNRQPQPQQLSRQEAQSTPPPLPVKQKSVTDTNTVRTNDSPNPPRIPERRPSLAQMPVDMVNGKRNSAFSEEDDITGQPAPPVPRRTVSVNKGRPDTDDSSTNTYAVVNKKTAPESPKPPPIPRKKSTPLKTTAGIHANLHSDDESSKL